MLRSPSPGQHYSRRTVKLRYRNSLSALLHTHHPTRLMSRVSMWLYMYVPKCPRQAPMYRISQGQCSSFYTKCMQFISPGKCPCGPKLRVLFKHPWTLARDTTVYYVSLIKAWEQNNDFTLTTWLYIWVHVGKSERTLSNKNGLSTHTSCISTMSYYLLCHIYSRKHDTSFLCSVYDRLPVLQYDLKVHTCTCTCTVMQ